MGKFKSVIKNLKDKISRTNQEVTDVADQEEKFGPEEDLVIVSDFAVALGTKFNEPTGDAVHDRFYWTARKALQPKYRPSETDKHRPAYYVYQVEGMLPEIHDYFAQHFKVRGSYLTYNGEYVAFPQKRVSQELNDYLTALAVEKSVTLSESEFGKLNYQVQPYGDDIRRGIQTESYYFQGQPYCLRIDPDQKNDQYQWYYIRPVLAHYTQDDSIQCVDVILADHAYDEKKFLTDLKRSVELSQSIPMLYPKTPWQKDQVNTNDKNF